MAETVSQMEKVRNMMQRFIAVAALIALFIVFSLVTDRFFTIQNILTIALQTSTLAFMGIGVTYVIITGGIDLSIGSVVALSGVVAGLAVRAGMPVLIGFLLALLAGWHSLWGGQWSYGYKIKSTAFYCYFRDDANSSRYCPIRDRSPSSSWFTGGVWYIRQWRSF